MRHLLDRHIPIVNALDTILGVLGRDIMRVMPLSARHP